jgi:mycoredoxin
MASDIQVYGTDWCGLTRELREYLMRSRFEYDYLNIDRDDDAQQFVLNMNDGRRRFPLVVVQHQVATQPTVAILQRIIREHGLQPAVRRARSIGWHAEQSPTVSGFSRARVGKDDSGPRTRTGRRVRLKRKRE